MPTSDFAVLDFETTGLLPRRHDRVIEVAIVRVDCTGRMIDEYATLVNPRRDLGPTHIHGLKAGDLLAAPEFCEIVGDVLALLENAILVAHNASFDLRFLRAEMERADINLPHVQHVCTMQLARAADPFACGRCLCDLCDYFGIELQHAHSALYDARAAATLLAVCLDQIAAPLGPPYLRGEIPAEWPSRPRSGRSFRREDASIRERSRSQYIATLLSRLPATSDEGADIDEYMALIDRVLEVRRITAEEADAIESLAEELDLSRERAIAAHDCYLADLMAVALEDDVISSSEQADLDEVSRLLAIPDARAAEILAEVRTRRNCVAETAARSQVAATDLMGKTICFTGQLMCTIAGEVIERSAAEHMAVERGMIPKSGVSMKLDYLVTADPDSMSGKAQKARKYGVRIIAERVFWQMAGMRVD